MIADNKVLIANGRQVAVTIHRLNSLDEGAEDFTLDVQIYENGSRNLDEIATASYANMRSAYNAIRRGESSEYISSINNGKVTLSLKTGEITLTQKELYRVLVRCREKV